MVAKSVSGSFKPYFKNLGAFIIMGLIIEVAGWLIAQILLWISMLTYVESGSGLVNSTLPDILRIMERPTMISPLDVLQILLKLLICGPLTLGLYRAAMTVAGGGKARFGDYFYFFRGVKRWGRSLVVSLLCLFSNNIVNIISSIGNGYTGICAYSHGGGGSRVISDFPAPVQLCRKSGEAVQGKRTGSLFRCAGT